MKKIVLPLLLLCGCGRSYQCDYFYNDICFESETEVNADEVERIVTLIDKELLVDWGDYPSISELLEHEQVYVKIWPEGMTMVAYCEPIPTNDGLPSRINVMMCEKDLLGLNTNGLYIDLQYTENLYYSALIHELLHTFEYHVLGKASIDHMTKDLFVEYCRSIGHNDIECVEGRLIHYFAKLLASDY